MAQEQGSEPRAASPAGDPRAALAKPQQGRGRVVVLSLASLTAAALPLPIVPDRILERLRGAIAHDVSTRYGLALTSEARALLASPVAQGKSALVRSAIETVGKGLLRRFGPAGLVVSVVRALETFALGHLLERYYDEHRSSQSVRVHGEEARVLREAIDRACMRALSPSLLARGTHADGAAEDLRDEFTRWIDSALLTGAALPDWLGRRLDAAFDAVVAEMPELGRA